MNWEYLALTFLAPLVMIAIVAMALHFSGINLAALIFGYFVLTGMVLINLNITNSS